MKQRAYWAWSAAALFYLYQYILRVSPGVMVTELRHDFQMTAEEFSTLGAVYLYAYSFLQIPLGLLLDRIGVRRMLLGSIALCMGGALLFGMAHSLWMLQIGRFLIGAGSAAAFMSPLKIAADWLPAGKRGFLIGFTLTLGTVGALTAGKPLVMLLDVVGWREAIIFVAAVGLAIWLFALVFIRLPKTAFAPVAEAKTTKAVFKDIWTILQNKPIVIYATVAIGVYTPLSVLADLWGTAFLMEKYGLSRADAAQTTMMMYFGLAIGSLLLPWLCEKWDILDGAIKICSFVILIIFCAILFAPNLGVWSVAGLLVLLGVFCGAEMICFTGAIQHTTQANSGLIIGVVNTLNMLGGAILQQGIGFLLDAQWAGKLDASGVRLYSTQNFVTALTLLLAVIVCCSLLSLRLGRK